MEERETIVNRVASSGLVTIDLTEILDKEERITYDLKQNLFQGMILREKDFRSFLKEHDWSEYENKHVAIYCSEDAIVPTWAYMLLATKLQPVAKTVVFGNTQSLEEAIVRNSLGSMDFSTFQDAKVVIKGCAELALPEFTMVEVTQRLMPFASSIMFGEPCSTVPIYKIPRKK